MNYLGHLSRNDPLHGYLTYDILPRIGHSGRKTDFRVFRFASSNHVYLYEETRAGVRVVVKFFGAGGTRPPEHSFRRMESEFAGLLHLRSLGFAGYPHYVARPLGKNADLDFALVLEHVNGEPLSRFLTEAIHQGKSGILFRKLSALAYFLASLHNRTANGLGVDFHRECAYLESMATQLMHGGHIGGEEYREFSWLRDRWRERPCAWEDQQVLVHGDATPSNFLFGEDPWVIVLDLERMKHADRAHDLGRIAGEIKHFFMQCAGNVAAAEPFIGHFLWEYACHFPDRNAAFSSVCRRVPFYIGQTLLRIGRNSWISGEHRRRLIEEAKKNLR